ncbi:hypothetical protein AB0K09_18280 [Streptomyces sp. NPDC049577]|uniref:hypothetical protein n=1 Tax=Streptomyces sp. NPDC049577 TaxID=3155153 RepID=UPI00342D4F3C
MSINNLPTGDDRRGAFRRPGFLAAAAFLGLVLVLAVVVITTGGSGKDDTPQATSPGSTRGVPPAGAGSPAATANACGLSDTDQTVPTSTPPNITWQLVKGSALPTSTIAGPGKVEGHVARCYAHTPLGALIAASQIGDRLGSANNAEAFQILKNQTVPGPGVDRDLQALNTHELKGGAGDGQMAAFQYVSYSPDAAVMNLVYRMNNGTFNVATFTVKWLDGDWKIKIQDNGADSSNVSQVTSTVGYIPWSGVS